MTHKNRKKYRIFMFLCTGCSLLRTEGFYNSLGVLYGGLGISKLQFLIKKIEIKFPTINFFQFQVINPWIRIRDPDPQSDKSMRIQNPGFVQYVFAVLSRTTSGGIFQSQDGLLCTTEIHRLGHMDLKNYTQAKKHDS